MSPTRKYDKVAIDRKRIQARIHRGADFRSGGEGIMDPLRTITGEALAKIYNVSPATLSKWVSRGEFPKPLKGGNHIWSVDAIKLYWLTSSIPKTYTENKLGKELIWREFEKYAP